MNVPSYAAAAAKLLERGLRQRSAPRDEDRARGVATIERALQAQARRRRFRTAFGVAAAAALVVLGWQGFHAAAGDAGVSIRALPAGEGATLRTSQRSEALTQATQLAVGQAVETRSGGGATFELSTGSSLQLAASSLFRVDDRSAVQRFALQRGELSAHVAKLSSGQRFIVATPDAELEVRGTRFKASVVEGQESCAGHRTRLEVSEGTVEVRSAGSVVRVTAGQRWPANCEAVERAEEQPPHLPATGTPDTAPVARSAAAGNTSHPTEQGSGLAQQNDLFAAAVALRRQGDVSAALRTYQELIARFPSSPLAENAAVERLRLLSAKRPARAREEARAYLKRYPSGFAVDEARQLASGP
ncbi:MAG TPA: FecR domain-containing protein [Polyangiaceae bacterium]